MVLSFLKSLYDKNYHHLSLKRIEEFKSSIQSNYKYIADKYGRNYFDLDQFEARYQTAVKRKFNLYDFFKSEIEAIDIFLNKVKIEESEKKQNTSHFFERVYHEEEPKVDSVLEKVYTQFEEKIKSYPKIFIHDDASEEIERLLGGLLELEPKVQEAMILAKNWSNREAIVENDFVKTKILYKDLMLATKSGLPFVFSNYLFKVENAGEDNNLIELADIDVLKKVVDFFKNLKQIIARFNHLSLKDYQEAQISYGNEGLNFEEFKNHLRLNCNKILKDFRLDHF